MANQNITQNDIMKLGTASIIISLLINIALVGFASTNIPYFWENDDQTYNSNIISVLSSQVPTQIYCTQGDETCTNELGNVPSEDPGQIDKLQSLFNVGKLILNIFIFIGMTPLMPLYLLNNVVTPYISNAWLIGTITVITLMWQLLIIYAIVKFIFKK